jgi:1,4-alpha-glucan branching enzyme
VTPGRLSVVLHTHMPYVEGFGTWPFGEEWLWEAIATSYVPLLDLLDRTPGRLTVSLTPVLCDQLEAPGVPERFLAFMRELRPESHRLDMEALPELAPVLERSAAAYAAAADAFERRGGDLVAAFAPHVAWTSAATHAVLPLLATDAGARLQVRTGVAAHRARFGAWGGGFWLPECAHAPWVDALLEEAGVRAVCVELTDVFGQGAAEHLRPLRSPAGPRLVPIDRSVIDLVWSPEGYPSACAYLDTHRLTERHHRAWSNDGAPYDPARARRRLLEDAADFVSHVRARAKDGGLCVCALDTELLGHWWPEGVDWLEAVIERAEADGLELVGLDEALAEEVAVPAPAELPVTSWGRPRDLATWSAPSAGGLAWTARAAELDVVHAGPRAGDRALRELLALQSSDWAFLVSRGTAGPYPRERAEGHARALRAALDGADGPGPGNLAPHLERSVLQEL